MTTEADRKRREIISDYCHELVSQAAQIAGSVMGQLPGTAEERIYGVASRTAETLRLLRLLKGDQP